MSEDNVLGLVEQVTMHGSEKRSKTVAARIDTGAQVSSIDAALAAELRLGPITEVKIIKSANGRKVRPVVHAEIDLHGQRFDELFTIADRSHMKYPILVGQNVLQHGFLIDPLKGERPEEED